jgi:hypothetical protein
MVVKCKDDQFVYPSQERHQIDIKKGWPKNVWVEGHLTVIHHFSAIFEKWVYQMCELVSKLSGLRCSTTSKRFSRKFVPLWMFQRVTVCFWVFFCVCCPDENLSHQGLVVVGEGVGGVCGVEGDFVGWCLTSPLDTPSTLRKMTIAKVRQSRSVQKC